MLIHLKLFDFDLHNNIWKGTDYETPYNEVFSILLLLSLILYSHNLVVAYVYQC
jgi:hypothetical protein